MNLTKEQIKNLLVFLNRVQLNGNEVEIFIQLKMLLVKELEKEEIIKEKSNNPNKAGN